MKTLEAVCHKHEICYPVQWILFVIYISKKFFLKKAKTDHLKDQ